MSSPPLSQEKSYFEVEILDHGDKRRIGKKILIIMIIQHTHRLYIWFLLNEHWFKYHRAKSVVKQ